MCDYKKMYTKCLLDNSVRVCVVTSANAIFFQGDKIVVEDFNNIDLLSYGDIQDVCQNQKFTFDEYIEEFFYDELFDIAIQIA